MPDNKKSLVSNSEDLKNKYTDIFTRQLRDYISEYIKPESENDKKKKRKNIYTDLNITRTALINYETDRLPKYELLFKIKEYFDLPFSYLFGETETTKLENLSNGYDLGLNDKSIEKLKNMKKDSTSDSIDNNYMNEIKLFVINSIINDKSFLDDFAFYLATVVGRKQTNKDTKIKFFKAGQLELDYIKYNIFSNYVKYIESLDENSLPPSIIKKAIEISTKYAGSKQLDIKEKNE